MGKGIFKLIVFVLFVIFFGCSSESQDKSSTDDPGTVTTRRTFYTAGPDTDLNTGDDEIFRYINFHYDSNRKLTGHTFYNDPGTDTDWFTPDDVIFA